MRLEALHFRPGKVSVYRAVFDAQTPDGATRMLRFSDDGHRISRWVAAPYDPAGENAHFGRQVTLRDLGHAALDGLFARLSAPDEWEEVWQITHGGGEE